MRIREFSSYWGGILCTTWISFFSNTPILLKICSFSSPVAAGFFISAGTLHQQSRLFHFSPPSSSVRQVFPHTSSSFFHRIACLLFRSPGIFVLPALWSYALPSSISFCIPMSDEASALFLFHIGADAGLLCPKSLSQGRTLYVWRTIPTF